MIVTLIDGNGENYYSISRFYLDNILLGLWNMSGQLSVFHTSISNVTHGKITNSMINTVEKYLEDVHRTTKAMFGYLGNGTGMYFIMLCHNMFL